MLFHHGQHRALLLLTLACVFGSEASACSFRMVLFVTVNLQYLRRSFGSDRFLISFVGMTVKQLRSLTLKQIAFQGGMTVFGRFVRPELMRNA